MWIKNATKLVRKRFLYRLSIFAQYWLNRETPKRPVFIVALPRTGSNLLISYMNSIPGSRFLNEIMHPGMYYGLRWNFIRKRTVLRHIVHSIYSILRPLCGAKIIYPRLRHHRITFTELAGCFPSCKFIITYRRSLLKQYISMVIADATHHWIWTPEFKLPDKIRLDPVKWRRFVAETRASYREMKLDPALGRNAVFVAYEDMKADAQKVFDEQLFPFLGVPRVEVSTAMKKQNTLPPEELVENWAEFAPLVSGGEAELDVVK